MNEFYLMIIPLWLREIIESRKKSLTVCLDICELSRILSHDEISFLMAINEQYYSDRYLHRGVAGCFKPFNILDDRRYVTDSSARYFSNPQEIESMIQRIKQLTGFRFKGHPNHTFVHNPNPYAIPNRSLLSHDAQDMSVDIPDDPITLANAFNFEIYRLQNDVYGMSFSLFESGKERGEQLIKAYKDAVKLLMGMHGLPEIALTPLFEAYIHEMSAR